MARPVNPAPQSGTSPKTAMPTSLTGGRQPGTAPSTATPKKSKTVTWSYI